MTSSGYALTLTGLPLAPQGLQRWGVNESADKLDDTDSLSGRVVHTETGCVDFDITIEVLLRTPAGVRSGQLVENLMLYQEAGVNPPDYQFSTVKVNRAARTVEERGQKKLTLSLSPCRHPTTGAACVVYVGGVLFSGGG